MFWDHTTCNSQLPVSPKRTTATCEVHHDSEAILSPTPPTTFAKPRNNKTIIINSMCQLTPLNISLPYPSPVLCHLYTKRPRSILRNPLLASDPRLAIRENSNENTAKSALNFTCPKTTMKTRTSKTATTTDPSRLHRVHWTLPNDRWASESANQHGDTTTPPKAPRRCQENATFLLE